MHPAVVKANVCMARLVSELDADIEAKDNNLATPLVEALEKNPGLLVSYLLGQGWTEITSSRGTQLRARRPEVPSLSFTWNGH